MATTDGSEVLDEEFLADQRALLDEQRAERAQAVDALAAEVDTYVHRQEEGAAQVEGFGRGETPSVELERARELHTQALARLAEVDAAVARLDAGSYGRCEVCGGPIGRARLEAIPTATHCINCQAARNR